MLLKKNKSCFIFLLSCLLHISSFSQQNVNLPFELFTINDGLSQGFVTAIFQDKKGFMWFGTSDGLNKYDGYKFTVYHNDPFDSTSLSDDAIACVYEDSKDRLWIGTRHHGLDVFDRENLVFYHLSHTTDNSIRSNGVLSISEDQAGAFWIRTDRGIDRLTVTEKKSAQSDQPNNFLLNHDLRFTHINMNDPSEGSRLTPVRPFPDSRGHVLVTSCTALYEIVFSDDQNSYTITKKISFPALINTPSIIEDTVHHFIFIHSEPGTFKFVNFDFSSPERIYTAIDFKSNLILDQDQKLWISDREKIIRLDAGSKGYENVSPNNPLLMPLISNAYCLYNDRNGVIWIGSAGYGILKFNPQKNYFHHIMPDVTAYQMFENNEREIIVNAAFAIKVVDKDVATVTDLGRQEKTGKYYYNSSIHHTIQDEKGNYWSGATKVISCYIPGSAKPVVYQIPNDNNFVVPFPFFFDSGHHLWFGYYKNLYQFDPVSKKFTAYNYPSEPETDNYDFLQCISEYGSELWLGTVHGLFSFDPGNNKWKKFQYNRDDKTSLSNNFIISFCNDPLQPGKYLWIGTRGGGLNRLDKTTGKFTCYNDKDGLPNNVVYGILTDKENNLWMSTNKGLSKFDPAKKTFQNFDVTDGLQSNEFDRYSYCKNSSGLLFFGGIKGINYFDPADIKPLSPPEVLITDFKLFNKSVSFKTPNSPLQKDITYTRSVTLNYDQNVITFQFAAMDYRKTGRVQYRYMMKGFDKDWIYSATGREATYTNLNPGDYTFLVQGSNAEGLWSKNTRELSVTIVPPWWRTLWFKALAVFIIALVIYGIYRYRVNQLLKLERMRNRIAGDLHDEIGSSLSTISIYSKVAQEHLSKQTSDPQPLLKKISDNTNEMMDAMSDIVWSITARNDRFQNIINRMREHAVELFEAKGYNLNFSIDERLNNIKLNMQKRKDFYLIYKEALNNITKYAYGKNVWITLLANNSNIILKIKDDGKGFNTYAGKNGNGLINMKTRAKSLNGIINIFSEPGKGTEIELQFRQ